MHCILAQSSSAGLFTYFSQSNTAGQFIVIALILFSFLAWSVMISKAIELKRLYDLNLRFEKTIDGEDSLIELGRKKKLVDNIPYSVLTRDALNAYYRAMGLESGDTDRDNAVAHAENALHRSVATESLAYERKMVVLASIVSGAPFMGLLGTVWGVMDAFGSIALQSSASLQNLAPGVSGALLTTVAGLLVAIPSVFGYNFLLSQTKRRVLELENFASAVADRIELENTVLRRQARKG